MEQYEIWGKLGNYDADSVPSNYGSGFLIPARQSSASTLPVRLPLYGYRAALHLCRRPASTLRSLGFSPPRRSEEEDLTYEEAPSPNGRKSFEGCPGPQQMSRLRSGQASTSTVPQLCERYVWEGILLLEVVVRISGSFIRGRTSDTEPSKLTFPIKTSRNRGNRFKPHERATRYVLGRGTLI